VQSLALSHVCVYDCVCIWLAVGSGSSRPFGLWIKRFPEAQQQAADVKVLRAKPPGKRARPAKAMVLSLPGMAALWKTDKKHLTDHDQDASVQRREGFAFNPLLGNEPYANDKGRVRPLHGTSLLAALVDTEAADLLGTEAMEYLVEYKWRRFAMRSFLAQALRYLLFVAFFTTVVLVQDAKSTFCGKDKYKAAGVQDMALYGVSAASSLLYLVSECEHMMAICCVIGLSISFFLCMCVLLLLGLPPGVHTDE
jgi:hypothetical protein